VAPGQVLQPLGAEDRLRLALSRLGLEVHLAQRAAGLEVAEVDVRLAADDVEVLAVRQVGAEAKHEHDMRPGGHAVPDGGRVWADAFQRKAQRSGQDGPGACRALGLDHERERVADPLGQHDAEDQAQDDERVMGQGQPRGPRDGPADDVVDDRGEHERHEDVREEDDDAPEEAADGPAHDRLDQAVGDVVAGGRQQDDEAPEDEGVRQPRPQVLEQPPLAEDEHAERLDPLRDPIGPIQRASGPEHRDVPSRAAPEEHDRRRHRDDDERIERDGGFHGSAPW
jgi:hypothetical protein